MPMSKGRPPKTTPTDWEKLYDQSELVFSDESRKFTEVSGRRCSICNWLPDLESYFDRDDPLPRRPKLYRISCRGKCLCLDRFTSPKAALRAWNVAQTLAAPSR